MKLALFDFDGTLTKGDSLFHFLKYYNRPTSLIKKSFIFSPYFLAHKLGIISNSNAKEKLCEIFFANQKATSFNKQCELFANEVIPKMIKQSAQTEINKHLQEENRIVIVSASFENYLMPYFKPKGIEVLGTRLAIREGKLSGKFKGLNCYGEEKVRRIKNYLDLSNYNEIHAYGDTKGDLPMLKLAQHAHYRTFL